MAAPQGAEASASAEAVISPAQIPAPKRNPAAAQDPGAGQEPADPASDACPRKVFSTEIIDGTLSFPEGGDPGHVYLRTDDDFATELVAAEGVQISNDWTRVKLTVDTLQFFDPEQGEGLKERLGTGIEEGNG